MTNIDKTLAERGERYGEFIEHALVTQNIKAAIMDSARWGDMADDQKEALEMVAHKIGRIVNGDPDYIDSWTDIIGYTRLVEKRLIDDQETAKQFGFKFPGGAQCQEELQDAEHRCHAGTKRASDRFAARMEAVLKREFGPGTEVHMVDVRP